jgi:hypothetical protein
VAEKRSLGPLSVLIDGNKLVDLLIQHGVGVQKRPATLHEIDESYFEVETSRARPQRSSQRRAGDCSDVRHCRYLDGQEP